MQAQTARIWPAWWYLLVALSVFVYLMPTWFDYALPPPVQDAQFSILPPVQVGKPLHTIAVRCSTAANLVSYDFVRTLQAQADGTEITLAAGSAIATPGCHRTESLMTTIPDGTVPGSYRLLMVITAHGFFRDVEVPYESESFQVGP